jgi:hypothetical protein
MLNQGSYTARQMSAAGYTVSELKAACYTADEIKLWHLATHAIVEEQLATQSLN